MLLPRNLSVRSLFSRTNGPSTSTSTAERIFGVMPGMNRRPPGTRSFSRI